MANAVYFPKFKVSEPMAISPSQRLGPYEILSAIGAGGMGEVYCARDTRLDRIVAIKILPDRFADRSNLRERFEREAKTIASLNHPHICTLYDVGRENATDYLVMEYIEGETLAQRLKKGPLPLEQTLRYAIEIADALDKAHRKGNTHRDLKPSNIMLTKSGAKLLDFGLAKLTMESKPATPYSELPTEKDAITAEGTILGTLQYMAPEQVEGKDVDARTDIFAFGAVVYEMATGKKAFEGKTSASVMAAILKDEPPAMSSLTPMTPPALDRVVKRCLAKDPENRWQTARDLELELKSIAESGSEATSPGASISGRPRTILRRAVVGGIVISVAFAIAGIAVWNRRTSPTTPVIRSELSLGSGEQFSNLDEQENVLALSPDGKYLAYVAFTNSARQIYLRSLDSFEVKPIEGTEGASLPFFSPDSQWVGFFAEGKLKKVSIGGGPIVTLCEALTPDGAAWGSNGTIVFAGRTSNPGETLARGLLTVPATGGIPKVLTAPDLKKGDVIYSIPELLPGGKAVLFNNQTAGSYGLNAGPIDSSLALYVLKTGERRDLNQIGWQPRYAPTGHLVYAQGGTLMAVPFDLDRLEVTGAAVPIVEGIARSAGTRSAHYSLSRTGTLAYLRGLGGLQTPQRKLVWADRKGSEQSIAAPPHAYRTPRISPDGKSLAISVEELRGQVWIYDFSRDTLTRLTFEGSPNLDPVWSPDGKRIVFDSGIPRNLFWQSADGSDKPERLATSDAIQVPNSWSPDGQVLAFHTAFGGHRDQWILRLSDRSARKFIQSAFNESSGRFSPDGRWLAYVSDESGRSEVYVQPYPGPGGKRQISPDGGNEPVWNSNGRELFYRNGDKMLAVEVTTQPSFSVGKPKLLFEASYMQTPAGSAYYDVSPDGQRFLMIKPVEQPQTAPTKINIVLNWFEELKQKVPTGKR
jgi:serine/threonine protein kinase